MRARSSALAETMRMLPICSDRSSIVADYLNGSDHISELHNARPKRPFFFLKPPSSILLPRAGPILRPHGINMHYEVELALVMGRQVRDLDERDESGALGAIGGYAVGIDMTARNVQDEAKKKGLPWSIAKGFDTFLPVRCVALCSQVNAYESGESDINTATQRIHSQISDS